jgi:hypothetical protein
MEVCRVVMGMISANVGLWLHDGATNNLADMIDAGFDAIEQGWDTTIVAPEEV